jgi:hypothetical protein
MIQPGNVYRIRMYQSDGIIPKGADTYRYKYIIIVGHDGNNFYGIVSTNTRDHHLVPIEFQYPLKHNDYRCYVNCYQLHQVSSKRLLPDCYKGKIADDDFELIIESVKNSPLIHEKILKKFGIIV